MPAHNRHRAPPHVRFWRYVAKGDGCWEWTGTTDGHGYGQLRVGGRKGVPVKAPRISYEIHHGPIPAGHDICHRCDNRGCVNPQHLFSGTRKTNLWDMYRKGRRRHADWQKLSEHDVIDIRTLRAFGARPSVLAREFGVTSDHVRKIANGDVWGWL